MASSQLLYDFSFFLLPLSLSLSLSLSLTLLPLTLHSLTLLPLTLHSLTFFPLSLTLLPLSHPPLSHPPLSHPLTSLTQYMFVTELDSSKKRAVHDELARLLVQYLKKKFENPQRLTMVLDVSV